MIKVDKERVLLYKAFVKTRYEIDEVSEYTPSPTVKKSKAIDINLCLKIQYRGLPNLQEFPMFIS